MCLVQGKKGMIEDVHGGHVVEVIYLCCLCHSIPPFIIVESGSGGLNLFVFGLLVPEGRKGGARLHCDCEFVPFCLCRPWWCYWHG